MSSARTRFPASYPAVVKRCSVFAHHCATVARPGSKLDKLSSPLFCCRTRILRNLGLGSLLCLQCYCQWHAQPFSHSLSFCFDNRQFHTKPSFLPPAALGDKEKWKFATCMNSVHMHAYKKVCFKIRPPRQLCIHDTFFLIAHALTHVFY